MADLEGQTALVTGGAGGIGAAIVRQLLGQGARVLIWDRNIDDLADLGTDRVTAQQIDLSSSAAIRAMAADTLAEHGVPHILVNNAGIQGRTAPVLDYAEGDWERVIAVNLTSVFVMCRQFAPGMVQRGYGRIINMASAAGVRGLANGCAYGAAKAGVIGFTKGLAKELSTTGVTVNCVAPALIETDLQLQMTSEFRKQAAARIPMGRLGRAVEVGAMVGWMASPACSFSTGAVFDISGGRLTE
jgi:3-oxoacyl-[acyl-carrier protein] reductase